MQCFGLLLENARAERPGRQTDRATAVLDSPLAWKLDECNELSLPSPTIAHPTSEESYFNNSALSDVSIILEDRTVPAHRVILCRGSDYFRKLLTRNFLVGYDSSDTWIEKSIAN